MYENPDGNYVFNAEICMGQKNFQFMVSVFYRNFQPYKEGQEALC